MIISDQELIGIVGGTVGSTVINSFFKGIDSIMDVGRSLGTALRRIIYGYMC
ncbi:MAG: hypothetical protein RR847_02890 [Bacilli bacterium]